MNNVIRLLQGNSFVMDFTLKFGKVPLDLGIGEDLIVGIYSEYNKPYIAKYSKGLILKTGKRGDGRYTMVIPFDISKCFKGDTTVEISIYDKDKSSCINTVNVLKMYFEERYNVNYI